jgi:Membrane protease subunits, stomatin/prohibitin homologs
MKKIIIISAVSILFLIGIIVGLSSVYTVHTNETAIVVRLGKAKYVVNNTGLNAHTPFIESVVKIFTGDMLYDIPASDVITADKKSMIADNYVIWSVTDPVKYYQTLGGVQGSCRRKNRSCSI